MRARYTQEFKLEVVRQVKAGQDIAVVAKVLCAPNSSLSKWVRLAAEGQIDDREVTGKAVKVTAEQMEMGQLRAEVARLRMERATAKKAAAYFVRDLLWGMSWSVGKATGIKFNQQGANATTDSPESKRWYSGQDAKDAGRNDAGGAAGQPATTASGPQRSGPLDAQGCPMGFYHSTRDNISAFDTRYPNRIDAGWLGRGIYGASDLGLAEDYARAKRGLAGLCCTNPLSVTAMPDSGVWLWWGGDPKN